MKISTILDYLKSDTDLVNMLGHTDRLPKITAYEPHDKNAYPYLYVSLTPFDLGIVTDQYRCEVRIITDDQLLIEKLTEKVTDLLHFRNRSGVKLNNQTLFHSTFAGNGFYSDQEKDLCEQVLFFSMTFKY